MKWLRYALLVTIVLLTFLPTPTKAATSADVVITASGYICGVPGSFTVYYISDYEVGLSWTKGADAANTMIRAAYGRLPKDRNDGYLVYYGSNTTTSDTAVNLDETASEVYYRAWSQNSAGKWEEQGASGLIEGIGVTALVIGIICLGLTIAGFVLKNPLLLLSAGIGWIIFGILLYEKAFENQAMNQAVLALGLVLALVSFVSSLTVFMRGRPAKQSLEERDYEEYKRRVIEATRRRYYE